MSHTKPSTEALDRALTILMESIKESDGRTTGVVSPEAEVSSFEVEKSALHDLKMHIDSHIITIARRRNSLLPVNKLPPELVPDILMGALPSKALREVKKLAQVQILWRDIILSNTLFWTHLSFGEPLETIALKLRRSKNAPLDIDYFHSRHQDYQLFFDLVAPHAHRWRAFSVQDCPLEVVRAHLETPLPVLERLIVSDDGKGPPFLNLVGGPRLRHVHIEGFEIPFQSGVLSNLLSLKIAHIPDTALMWVLPGILSGCPYLQEFSLECIELRTAGAMELSAPLILPHLTKFHLCNVATSLSSRLLRFLHPNDRCFYTTISNRNATDALETLDLLLSPRNEISSILDSMFAQPRTSIEFGLRDGSTSISACPFQDNYDFSRPPDSHEIHLHIDCWPTITGEWRHRFPFTSAPFPNVKLWYRGIANAEAEDAIFDFLPTVNCLAIGSTLSRATRIVQKLLEPKIEGGWRWPRLERIELNVRGEPGVEGAGDRATFLRSVQDLVNKRKSTGGVTVKLYHGLTVNQKELRDVRKCLFLIHDEDPSDDDFEDDSESGSDEEDAAGAE